MTPKQQAFLFGSRNAGINCHFYFGFETIFPLPMIELVLKHLIERHDALRMHATADGYMTYLAPEKQHSILPYRIAR